jgi:CheY-like chemotaxis protein
MAFLVLLVSKDEETASILQPVVSRLGLTLQVSSYPDALCRLTEQKFDAVIVDFDDLNAKEVLKNTTPNAAGRNIITAAILSNPSQVRGALGEGANFVLYRPLSPDRAEASLRAAAALIKRERRGSHRVSVQTAVKVRLQGTAEVANSEIEGIMLDVSEDGMDLLASTPFRSGAVLALEFALPGMAETGEYSGEVAWSNPNGQCGVRFLDLPQSSRTGLKEWVVANADSLPPDPEPVAQCKLTDLSLGGCYVESESPFPEGSQIVMSLRAAGMDVRAEGMVSVMHPEHGMGIEFAARTEEQRDQVGRFIDFLSSTPGTLPQLFITPRSLVGDRSSEHGPEAEHGVEDPLLDLLRKATNLDEHDFLAQLHQQRGSQEVAQ